MSKVFTDYNDAYDCARDMASACGHDYGILKKQEYSEQVFSVFLLPRQDHRTGFELRCEVVPPSSPRVTHITRAMPEVL